MEWQTFKAQREALQKKEQKRTLRIRGSDNGEPAKYTLAWVATRAGIGTDLVSLYQRTGKATPANAAKIWAAIGVASDAPRNLDEAVHIHVPNKVDIRTSGDPFSEPDESWQAAVPFVSLAPIHIRIDPHWPGAVELQGATLRLPEVTEDDVFDWFYFCDFSKGGEGFHNISGRVVPIAIEAGRTWKSDVIFHCERLRGQLEHSKFLRKLRQSRSDPIRIEVEYRFASTTTRDVLRKSFRIDLGRDNIEKCFAYCEERGRTVPRWMQIVPFHREKNINDL